LYQCDGRCGYHNSYLTRKGGRLAIEFEKHAVPTNVAVIDERTRKIVFETSLRAGGTAAAHPKRELIAYSAPWGEQLHATLVYPQNFSPQKKYPMVVIVYHRESRKHHWFETAVSDTYQNAAHHARNGYFVLKPDLSARIGDPGRSAMQCLDAALDAVAKLSAVDMTRIGIVGASEGGYHTLMALCTSDRFAAGVAVNPLTDLATHSVDLFAENGETNLGYILTAQKMEVPFWEDVDRYAANSPLHLVKGMKTPLLLGVGRKDDNVNWRQSIYFFNALRTLGKPVEMVLYPTAGHGFDFPQWSQRVDRFLDQSLKARP
jgi:dipeptidyl aminopeptidase/acylaminoacyl peptidase